MRSWPLLFIIIPLVELYVLIKIGSYIGALWTVLIVIMTAVIGVQMLRVQGFSTLQRAQLNMAQGTLPAMEMMEGIILAVGGALLITPGFITDTLGFLCLIPATRRAFIRRLMINSQMQMHGFQDYHSSRRRDSHPGGRTLDGEFRREDD